MIQDTSGQDRVVKRPAKKRYGLIIVAVLLIGGGSFMYPAVKRWTSADMRISADRLNYAQVARGDLVRSLDVEGQVVASSYPTLYAPAEGKVSLFAKPGDRVKEGQTLAVVDSPELQNRLLQERSQVESLEAEWERQKITARSEALKRSQEVDIAKLKLASAKRALVRAEKTHQEGLMSAAEFEAAEDLVKETELDYKHAQEEAGLNRENMDFEVRNKASVFARGKLALEELERQVTELTMTSPVNGVVGTVHVDPRDLVAQNAALLTVIDLSALQVEIRIPEAYADEISTGDAAVITYENQEYRGMVAAVAPEVNNSVVLGTVVFDGAMPAGLKQNQRVTTEIRLESRNNVLKVRRGPFLESGGGGIVYVVAGGAAERRTVRTGATSLTEVEIISGLSEGETIVLSNLSRFGDAKKVHLSQ